MSPRQALAFVRRHGVVLESARGPVPTLAEVIAGGPIRGSWWSHPRSHTIFAATRAIRESDEILVCRLVGGRITYVHRRLWPALVRVARRFPRRDLARLDEQHTPSGRHVTRRTDFPSWVPEQVSTAASRLRERDALVELGSWVAQERAPSRGPTLPVADGPRPGTGRRPAAASGPCRALASRRRQRREG